MSIRRFLGCPSTVASSRKTVKTVDLPSGRCFTPLKRGVNESGVCSRKGFKHYSFLAILAVLLGVFCLSAVCSHAAESSGIRVEAILVWATHTAKTNDANLKELDPALAKKLSKRFKWPLYYEVRRKEASVSEKDLTKVPISEKCMLEVKHLGDHRFEVKLIGKGKPVSRSVESLANGHIMIVGGDDKNDTAWLIVIKELPAKK